MSSSDTHASAPAPAQPHKKEDVSEYKGPEPIQRADEGNPNDNIDDDPVDGNLADFVREAAGHEQPARGDTSFPAIGDALKVDPATCITRPNILVKNGKAWRNDVEEPANGEPAPKGTYSAVLMEWFRERGMLESGTSKFVSGVGAVLMSATLVGIPYVVKSMHVVEHNFFGAARTKSGEVKVYPPGYRGNFSLNRVDFQKCDFDQKYINYNGALHVLRVLPGEVAVVSVDGSDMILGPGDDGEVGYHVIVNPNVQVKQEQTEAHRLPHLKCGLWHMVHVQKGQVRHVNIDGVDYALFHKPGGHWLMHRKFELGEVYRTNEAFDCRTLHRFIVPNGQVAGFIVDGRPRIVTEACSAWLSTERPVKVVAQKPYDKMETYTCGSLTLMRLTEMQRAVVMTDGVKYELTSGTHVLRLPARLVAIVDVAVRGKRVVNEDLRDQNNVPVDVNWQYAYRVVNTDAYTRWSPDQKEAEIKVEKVLLDMVIAMARCIQVTELYEASGDERVDGSPQGGGDDDGPSDRVRRICAAKTEGVRREYRARLAQRGVDLTTVWVRAVTPRDPATLAQFNRVAEQRAKDYAVRRREEQEAIMKEVRVASAERQAEEKRMELERQAEAERRADDIRRATEEHLRKNEAGELAAKQELQQQKQRNAAELELQQATERQKVATAVATGEAEREAEVALRKAKKSAEVRRVEAETAAQLNMLQQQKDLELRRGKAEAEAALHMLQQQKALELKRAEVEAEAARVALENEAKLNEERRNVQAQSDREQVAADGNASVAKTVREQRKADFEQRQAERERELELRAREQAIEHEREMQRAAYEKAMAEACPEREKARVYEAIGRAMDASGVTVRGNMTAQQLADTMSSLIGTPVQVYDGMRAETLEGVLKSTRMLANVGVTVPTTPAADSSNN